MHQGQHGRAPVFERDRAHGCVPRRPHPPGRPRVPPLVQAPWRGRASLAGQRGKCLSVCCTVVARDVAGRRASLFPQKYRRASRSVVFSSDVDDGDGSG